MLKILKRLLCWLAPLADLKGACRHEAVYCALILGEHYHQDDIRIMLGDTVEGPHAECRLRGTTWVRMTYHGIIFDDQPFLTMDNMKEFTLSGFLRYCFGWSQTVP